MAPGAHASMRPSDITDGNFRRESGSAATATSGPAASMRPSDITDGNGKDRHPDAAELAQATASMRPSDITDGNPIEYRKSWQAPWRRCSFNEAVGYYRRKLAGSSGMACRTTRCFNEAVGYYRRKPAGVRETVAVGTWLQ